MTIQKVQFFDKKNFQLFFGNWTRWNAFNNSGLVVLLPSMNKKLKKQMLNIHITNTGLYVLFPVVDFGQIFNFLMATVLFR